MEVCRVSLFRGTAQYYAQFRPGYPEGLIRLLAERAQLGPQSRVLDVGCGTGQLAVPLAAHAGEVVAVDVEQEMLDAFAAPPNLTKVCARAEEIDGSWGRFDLVTIGNAFHWMEPWVLERLPSPRVALLNNGDAPQVVSRAVAEELLGSPPAKRQPTVRYDESLLSAGFTVEDLSTVDERFWTVDELVGLAFSTSWASPARLGERKDEYERELRRRLEPGVLQTRYEAFLGSRGDE
jgi:SAM-dependent methyltransferase